MAVGFKVDSYWYQVGNSSVNTGRILRKCKRIWRSIRNAHNRRYFYAKDFEGFYDVSIDLTIMTAKIICKDVNVEKVSNSTLNIFWWEEEEQTERR